MTIQIGQKAPDFTMPSTLELVNLSQSVKLTDYQGKWLVLFFYPADFSRVCPTEIRGFNSRLDEFKAIHAEVLGVSTDNVYSHRAWIQTPVETGGLGSLNYPLASDIT